MQVGLDSSQHTTANLKVDHMDVSNNHNRIEETSVDTLEINGESELSDWMMITINNRNGDNSQQQGSNDSSSNSNDDAEDVDDDRDDRDDDKKGYNGSHQDEEESNDLEEEEEEEETEKKEEKEDKVEKEEKEQEKVDRQMNENKTNLNVDAPQFIPKNYSKRTLVTINECENESKQITHNKLLRLPLKCAGSIEIPRILTQNIIPSTIKENIYNIYHFMDKSTALRENRNILKNETFVIINYDFHDKDTDEILYCIIQRQDPRKHCGFSWIMMDRLFTKNQILNEFNMSQKELSLPTSSRAECKIIEQMNYIQPIRDMLQTQFPHNIVERTQWHRIPIYNRTNNRKRKILYLTKKEFMKKIEYFSKNTRNTMANIVPIMILNSNKEYWIEHIYIIKIDENVDIGISMKYKPNGNRIEVTGIHLDKEYILNKHQLAAPNHECKCLEHFDFDIDDLKIGNIDQDKNRIKDLQKRHKIITKENNILKKENDNIKNENNIIKEENANLTKNEVFYKNEYLKLKKIVTKFMNEKELSSQLLMEAKEALDNDDNDNDDEPYPIPTTAVINNANLNTPNMNTTAISVPSFSIPISSTYPFLAPPSLYTLPPMDISMYTSMLSTHNNMISLCNLPLFSCQPQLPQSEKTCDDNNAFHGKQHSLS